jgi:hypothetical protein
MALNGELQEVVRSIYQEIVGRFKAEGVNLGAPEFLSSFPRGFIHPEYTERIDRIVAASFSSQFKSAAERTVEAYYSNHHGGTTEFYICDAVEDFLNYAIPRAAGLEEESKIFEDLYSQFDSCMFGEYATVSTFAILSGVWDSAGRVHLPEKFSLRYIDKPGPGISENRFLRNRNVPYLEICKTAHPIGWGREINAQHVYFIFEHSTTLPKTKDLLSQICKLRDEMARKFILAVRLLDSRTPFSDYRGFRTLGHLAGLSLNIMNFPDEQIEGGTSCDLSDVSGTWLGKLLPELAKCNYARLSVIDTKFEDALRRTRDSMMDSRITAKKVAIDQLLDYFQILEAVLPVAGSEYISVYAAALLKASGNAQFTKKPYETYQFVKRMCTVRNKVMHGRFSEVLGSKPEEFAPDDVLRFGHIIRVLASLSILNSGLREMATRLAVGDAVSLESLYNATNQEVGNVSKRRRALPAW